MVFLYYKRFFLFQEYPKDVASIATFKNNKYKKVTTTIKLIISNEISKSLKLNFYAVIKNEMNSRI